MEALKERILRDGENLGKGILKVDSFINHQVDPELMLEAGKHLSDEFASVGATKVLTAEISGIAPALTTALGLGIPLLYARKTKPVSGHRFLPKTIHRFVPFFVFHGTPCPLEPSSPY